MTVENEFFCGDVKYSDLTFVINPETTMSGDRFVAILTKPEKLKFYQIAAELFKTVKITGMVTEGEKPYLTDERVILEIEYNLLELKHDLRNYVGIAESLSMGIDPSIKSNFIQRLSGREPGSVRRILASELR